MGSNRRTFWPEPTDFFFQLSFIVHVDHYHEVSMLMVELLGTGGAWDR